MEDNPTNPHLADIFKTMLTRGAPDDAVVPSRSLVVSGNQNVIVCGGTVYMESRSFRDEAAK